MSRIHLKKYLSISVILLISFFLFAWFRQTTIKIRDYQAHYLVTGSGNPGVITLYERTDSGYTSKKTIDTGFQFVHTVRLGDIYNNGAISIVAGVSNSFFKEPYGCQVVAYDLGSYQQKQIDVVGDLRCKDITIGNADNDGKNEIVLGTHGNGLVKMYSWERDAWTTTTLETNFIEQVDAQKRTNHRVPNADVPCKTCVIQTAVHIVKIGDVDNDGKNEIVTTMSSPLELIAGEEISFVRVYRKSGDSWSGETVDSLVGREFRSITIDDIYGNGKNTLLVGIGSPRNDPGSLIAYDLKDGEWQKTIVHNDKTELNMKGVAVGTLHSADRSILLATGFPNANIMTFNWTDNQFSQKSIGSIAALFNLPDAQYNSMVAAIPQDKDSTFVVAGNTLFPKEKIGWEVTNKGFLVQYDAAENSWLPTIISTQNILGFDLR